MLSTRFSFSEVTIKGEVEICCCVKGEYQLISINKSGKAETGNYFVNLLEANNLSNNLDTLRDMTKDALNDFQSQCKCEQ